MRTNTPSSPPPCCDTLSSMTQRNRLGGLGTWPGNVSHGGQQRGDGHHDASAQGTKRASLAAQPARDQLPTPKPGKHAGRLSAALWPVPAGPEPEIPPTYGSILAQWHNTPSVAGLLPQTQVSQLVFAVQQEVPAQGHPATTRTPDALTHADGAAVLPAVRAADSIDEQRQLYDVPLDTPCVRVTPPCSGKPWRREG